MPTVKLVDEKNASPRVKAIYEDIKATKKIDFVPNFWRALASHPDNLERAWNQGKSIMKDGKVSLLIPTAQIGGFFLGPVIAGQLLTPDGGFGPANTLAIACCLLALAIFIPVALRLRGPAAAPASAG